MGIIYKIEDDINYVGGKRWRDFVMGEWEVMRMDMKVRRIKGD